MILKCLYLILVVGALVVPADAINCYVCNSLANDGCGDPFGSSASKAGCEQCSKLKGTQGSIQVVIRGCEPLTVANNGCASQTKDGASGELCLCDSNQCNAASTPVTYIPILLAAFALASTKTFMY